MTQPAAQPAPNTDTPKRHCMVVHAHYPLAETRVQRQAEALLAQGYEVDVICLRTVPPQTSAFEVVRGVNVYHLPVHRLYGNSFLGQLLAYVFFFVLATFKVTRLYRQKKYGVVQVHNLPDLLVFCALWPKLAGAKVILDIHDVMPEFLAERLNRPLTSWPVKGMIWQEQLSCRFADHVITVTELWRQALIKRGVPAAKVSVVMNLADTRLFHPGVRCQIANQDSPETFRLVYHGTQAARHGLDTLLYALAQIRFQAPHLRLILHGRGDYQHVLMRLAHQLELAEQVHFSDEFMPVTELPAFIARCDAGVIPYRDDTFTGGILPTKLMEYVALGLPVIAARTTAIRAYFDESMLQFFEPGNVEELADSILKLYQDRAKRENLIRHSARFHQQYNWASLSLEYVALIDLLHQRNASQPNSTLTRSKASV